MSFLKRKSHFLVKIPLLPEPMVTQFIAVYALWGCNLFNILAADSNSCGIDYLEYTGPHLNIKTVLSTYGDFHVKDKTAVRTSYL